MTDDVTQRLHHMVCCIIQNVEKLWLDFWKEEDQGSRHFQQLERIFNAADINSKQV